MRREIVSLPTGWAGTDATVRKIHSIVESSLQDPTVVLTAQNLVRHLPERDKDAEIRAVSRFVRSKIRYTNEGIETLKTPRVMLDEIKRYGKAVGDCDDHVILWLSLHRALGNKVRVKVISQHPSRLANHIYGEVYSPKRGWIADELIVKNRNLGWEIPSEKVTESKTYQMGNTLGGLGMVHEFRPGGARRTRGDMWMPGDDGGYAAVPSVTTSHLMEKRGGAVTMNGNGYLSAIGGEEGDIGWVSELTQGLELVQKLREMREERKRKKRERRRREAEERAQRQREQAERLREAKMQRERELMAARPDRKPLQSPMVPCPTGFRYRGLRGVGVG